MEWIAGCISSQNFAKRFSETDRRWEDGIICAQDVGIHVGDLAVCYRFFLLFQESHKKETAGVQRGI